MITLNPYQSYDPSLSSFNKSQSMALEYTLKSLSGLSAWLHWGLCSLGWVGKEPMAAGKGESCLRLLPIVSSVSI